MARDLESLPDYIQDFNSKIMFGTVGKHARVAIGLRCVGAPIIIINGNSLRRWPNQFLPYSTFAEF